MKKNKAAIIGLCVALVMCFMPGAVHAYTAEGTSGTVQWTIDEEGTMVFSPVSGTAGTLAATPNEAGDSPFIEYRDQIRKIRFEGIVKAPSRIRNLFKGLDRLEELEQMEAEEEQSPGQLISGPLGVSVQDVRYSGDITKRYSEAQEAEIAKQKALNEQEAAKVKAETKVIEAKGEADANKVLAESLSPEVISQHYIEALESIGEKGNLVVVPEGATPIVGNVGKSK